MLNAAQHYSTLQKPSEYKENNNEACCDALICEGLLGYQPGQDGSSPIQTMALVPKLAVTSLKRF